MSNLGMLQSDWVNVILGHVTIRLAITSHMTSITAIGEIYVFMTTAAI